MNINESSKKCKRVTFGKTTVYEYPRCPSWSEINKDDAASNHTDNSSTAQNSKTNSKSNIQAYKKLKKCQYFSPNKSLGGTTGMRPSNIVKNFAENFFYRCPHFTNIGRNIGSNSAVNAIVHCNRTASSPSISKAIGQNELPPRSKSIERFIRNKTTNEQTCINPKKTCSVANHINTRDVNKAVNKANNVPTSTAHTMRSFTPPPQYSCTYAGNGTARPNIRNIRKETVSVCPWREQQKAKFAENFGHTNHCYPGVDRKSGGNDLAAPKGCNTNTSTNYNGNYDRAQNAATGPCNTNSRNNSENNCSWLNNDGHSNKTNALCNANTSMNFRGNYQYTHNSASEPNIRYMRNDITKEQSGVNNDRRANRTNAQCNANTPMNFKGNCKYTHNSTSEPNISNMGNNTAKYQSSAIKERRPKVLNTPCNTNTSTNYKSTCQYAQNIAPDPSKRNSINITGKDRSDVQYEGRTYAVNGPCNINTSLNFKRNCQNTRNTAPEPCKRCSINNTEKDYSCVGNEGGPTRTNPPRNANTSMNFKRNCQNTYNTASEPCKPKMMNYAEEDYSCVGNEGRTTRSNMPCNANTSMNYNRNFQNEYNTAPEPFRKNSMNKAGNDRSCVSNEGRFIRPNNPCIFSTSMNFKGNCENTLNTASELCKRNLMINAGKDHSCVGNEGHPTRPNTSMNYNRNCQNAHNTASEPFRKNSMNNAGNDRSCVSKEGRPTRQNDPCNGNTSMNFKGSCQNTHNAAPEPFRRNMVCNTGKDRLCVSNEGRPTRPITPCNTNTYMNFKTNCQTTHNTAPASYKKNSKNNAENDRSCVSKEGRSTRPNTPCIIGRV
ncbi:putative uncharacterized protein DDB_G0282133 [Teleopsis dalmanni]|uniref:putative uncharacterized protein DDB_G0282133 n=1 Tax=Teleopsis dalmanni TaxID=139649 RepID=UPI0018CFCCA8|nr:putative uncharacterized protein DDB_G0282133 [Teleopsis dalmanni]